MWECCPVSFMELPSRFSKKWRRCICSDDYWIVVTTMKIRISLPAKIQIKGRMCYAEVDSWKWCSSRVKVGRRATIKEREVRFEEKVFHRLPSSAVFGGAPLLTVGIEIPQEQNRRRKLSANCNKTANIKVKKLYSIKQCLTATRPTSHN